jgi:hypothetical protein
MTMVNLKDQSLIEFNAIQIGRKVPDSMASPQNTITFKLEYV